MRNTQNLVYNLIQTLIFCFVIGQPAIPELAVFRDSLPLYWIEFEREASHGE